MSEGGSSFSKFIFMWIRAIRVVRRMVYLLSLWRGSFGFCGDWCLENFFLWILVWSLHVF